MDEFLNLIDFYDRVDMNERVPKKICERYAKSH